MSEVARLLAEQLASLSPAECIAVATALAYLALAIRQNIWCWPSACVSTAIYIGLFVDARLYMEAVLNLFYFGMALYGWHAWRHGARDGGTLPVTSWPLSVHCVAIAVLVSLAAVNGWFLAMHSDAVYPYVDSLTTWSAIWATFLVARKVYENWWYWLAIDSVSIAIYWLRDLELTALLFIVYVCMIPFGLVSWRRSMRAPAAA